MPVLRKPAQVEGGPARARLTSPSGFQEVVLLASGLPCCQGEFVSLASNLSCEVGDIGQTSPSQPHFHAASVPPTSKSILIIV